MLELARKAQTIYMYGRKECSEIFTTGVEIFPNGTGNIFCPVEDEFSSRGNRAHLYIFFHNCI